MRPRRILIVDDDDSVRALLRLTLPTQEDLAISEARNGREALSLVESELPDLVLLDWRMPGATGAEVLAKLKSLRPELPVIVLTAEFHVGHRASAMSLGADVFLTKPFSPLELLREIERLLPALGAQS